MKPYFGLRGGGLQAAIWGVSCFCIMIFGYNNGVVGGVLGTTSFQDQFPQMKTIGEEGPEQHHRAVIQGTVIALYTLSGTFGALFCTFLGDVLGRRRTIFAAATTQVVGAILMGTSFGLAQFIVSRLVIGLGTGGIIATTSVWQSELSKPSSRGAHVCGFGVFTGAGLAIALWIDLGTHFYSSTFAWRFPFIFQVVFGVIVMAFIPTMPESPRWLVKRSHISEAADILSLVYDETVDSAVVTQQIHDIQLSIELSQDASLVAMFKEGRQRTLHRVVLAISIQIYLQLTGINAISYYTGEIYQEYLHFNTTDSDILAACTQFSVIIGSIACSLTVDRFGRRKLMLISSASMAICQGFLTGLVSVPENKAAAKAAVFFVFLYVFVYVLGFLGIPFLYASEIAPVQSRAAVYGISVACSWLFNFLIAEVTPVAFSGIGYRYFIVYAAVNIAWVPVIYFFFPETSGRSLEEIDEIFASSETVWDPVKIANKLPRKHLSEYLAEDGKLAAGGAHVEDISKAS